MSLITTNVPQPAFGPTGFTIPAADAILAGVQADINAAFGGNLNMGLSTPQGQLASSMAAVISNTYQNFLFYTTQTDPAYAIGRMQDAIARIYFLARNSAQSTVVACTCVGLAGTIIPAGAQAADISGNMYFNQSAVAIPSGGSVTATFYNQAPGPTPCPADTLTSIYKAIPGWDSINNPSDGVIGNATETRSAFELRRQASVAGNSVGTIQAIQGAIWKVPGVLDVYCYQNDTGIAVTVGGVTIQPHAIYVGVAGGDPQAVGQAIWSKKSPGCEYYAGNTSVTVLDTSPGYNPPYPSYTVTFETLEDQTIGFLVILQSNPQVPSTAAVSIQNEIVLAFAGGDGGPRASTGSTIFASRFYAPVASLGSWAQIISITLVSGWTAAATATALISGTTMTVTAIGSGALAPGQVVTGPSMLNATIVSQLSGTTGSTGTYQLSNSQTVGSSAVSAYAISANSVTLNIDDEPVTAAANVLVVIN